MDFAGFDSYVLPCNPMRGFEHFDRSAEHDIAAVICRTLESGWIPWADRPHQNQIIHGFWSASNGESSHLPLTLRTQTKMALNSSHAVPLEDSERWTTKRSCYSDKQIAYVLKQADGGSLVADVFRQIGISEASSYVVAGRLRSFDRKCDESKWLVIVRCPYDRPKSSDRAR